MRIPKESEHQLFIGTNGSGKTTLATHVLSYRNFDEMPYVILNTKDDELLNQIPGAVELDGLKLPKEKQFRRGIFMARPMTDDWDGIEKLMMEIWQRTHIGLFVDEAMSISDPRHPAYRQLLTQGRSRRNPVDSNTQRPRWIDRYAFTESNHIYVMRLNDLRDLTPIQEQTGKRFTDEDGEWFLPEYHAFRFYAPERELTIVPPAPADVNVILQRFEDRLRPERDRTIFI